MDLCFARVAATGLFSHSAVFGDPEPVRHTQALMSRGHRLHSIDVV